MVEFADLNTKVASVVERYGVEAATLAKIMGVDKATAWRWLKNPAGQADEKQKKLVDSICAFLATKKINVSSSDFQLNSLNAFLDRLGLSKIRAAELSGLSLPIPESLVEAAREATQNLMPFCNHYRFVWRSRTQNMLRHGFLAVRPMNDGRIAFDLNHNGRDSFQAHGYFVRRGAELHLIGDKIDPFQATQLLFVLPLEAEYNRSQSVVRLRGYMTEWLGRQLESNPVVMVPCSEGEVSALQDICDGTIEDQEAEKLIGRDGMSFLKS